MTYLAGHPKRDGGLHVHRQERSAARRGQDGAAQRAL